ncbi:MAG: cytochrome c-type biogenesis protein CcmH [Clostridia bacterium]|nr:cytochrome c-type biogenesis protein CcmH [Deltaproteobacteria bacterium]
MARQAGEPMMFVLAMVVVAQVAPVEDGGTPKSRAPEVDEETAVAVGRTLRCPVCQGMPISESPSDMAQAMMKRVREMQAEGKSRDAIVTYFTQRYGDWVLLEPRAAGLNWALWLLPPVVLLAGFFVMRRYTRGTQVTLASVIADKPADDPYLAAVRREVDR